MGDGLQVRGRVVGAVCGVGKGGRGGEVKQCPPGMTMQASVSTLFCFHGPFVNSLSRKEISYVLT